MTDENEVPTPAHRWAHATVRGKEPLSRELMVNVRRARLVCRVSADRRVYVSASTRTRVTHGYLPERAVVGILRGRGS